jgi:hypothetical protein
MSAPPPYYAQPYELPPGWTPPPKQPVWPRIRTELETFIPTVALVTLLGAPVAFLWRAFAPRTEILHTASGPQPVAPESNQLFAVDGRYVVVTLLAGLLCGVIGWTLLRRRGPAGPIALAAGATIAALVTKAVGGRLVVDRYLYNFCHGRDVQCLVYSGTLRLNAIAAIVVWPLAAMVAFAALTLFFDREEPPAAWPPPPPWPTTWPAPHGGPPQP